MSEKKGFEFELHDQVSIKVSGEAGEVISRQDSTHTQNFFQVRYVQANGVAASKWWAADALEKV